MKPHAPESVASDLRQRAIRLLTRREHSCLELARKLAGHGTEDEIIAVLSELKAMKLQSDARFAESYVSANATGLGLARLRHSLLTKGVAAELVDAQLAAQLSRSVQGDETARARAVWARKFGVLPVDARDWAKQARFLQSRGFAAEVIRQLLRDMQQDLKDARRDEAEAET